jgi:hypothetical protein
MTVTPQSHATHFMIMPVEELFVHLQRIEIEGGINRATRAAAEGRKKICLQCYSIYHQIIMVYHVSKKFFTI